MVDAARRGPPRSNGRFERRYGETRIDRSADRIAHEGLRLVRDQKMEQIAQQRKRRVSLGPTEFQDPSSNCLIRDVETTLGKQVLNVPIAQRETAIEPDGMLDDDRWKAVTTVG